MLAPWGVRIGSALVADPVCANVPLRTPSGPLPVPYPLAPIVNFEVAEEHLITRGLQHAVFFFPSPLEIDDGPFREAGGQVLARTSPGTWLTTGDSIDIRPRRPGEWEEGPEAGPQSVLVALSGRLHSAFEPARRSDREARVVIAGTGSMPRDSFLPSPATNQSSEPLELMAQVIEWLSEDPGLLAIRMRDPITRRGD